MKYGIWNISRPDPGAVNALAGCGYPPLAAMVLSARGLSTPKAVAEYLGCNAPLHDPFLMTDMDKAVERISRAIARKERIAVFGDYDVDGITSTCLLGDFLRSRGADCLCYIPSRLEEGYGLNPIAIRQLAGEGVKLIVTVDCGITAVAEAELCRSLGIDLVITDHHECKEQLPAAVAVVDPHRPDGGYPHKNLSGVGVAFKLACAINGSSEAVLAEYADLVCLGTVADVMLLQGENRVFVDRGLACLRCTRRPGFAALMKEAGCAPEHISAATIGYNLAPRINAAGRMGRIGLALELFLTHSDKRAAELAAALCELNRQRQSVESEIYEQAVSMLGQEPPEAIVLADESWHQGVVGIVASRLAEEFCCPAFLICLDGEHGKASSRSFGGFNLFSALSALSPLLESYGGHELAAGFTIRRSNIIPFRQQICRLAAEYYALSGPRTQLDVDCVIPPELLSVSSIDALSALEPCGNGCPKPVFAIEKMRVDRITMVGGGRHMRLRLRCGRHILNAIYFSANAQSASIAPGDLVDVAFNPQVNEYRGERSVQLSLLDIRPSCNAECSPELHGYSRLADSAPTPAQAALLLPDRRTLGDVWHYLAAAPQPVQETPLCLCRKIVRRCGRPLSQGKLLVCLDIFRDVGLLSLQRQHKTITVTLSRPDGKADLYQSATMQRLLQLKRR